MGFAIAGGIGVAGIASGIASSNAANSASNAEQNAAAQSAATQQSIFNTEEQNTAPYREAGDYALGQIHDNMSGYNAPFTMGDFHADPGYQFDLQQGQQAIQNSSAATGGLVSGSQMAALNNYSQNMASNEYSNAYNRYQTNIGNSYNRLASLAGLGQTGVGQSNQAAQTAGTNISNSQMSAGNAQAANSIAQGNAISNGVTGVANAGANYATMSSLYPGGVGGSTGGYNASVGNPAANWNPTGMTYSSPNYGELE